MYAASSIRLPVGGSQTPLIQDLFRVALLTDGLTVTLARGWGVEAADLDQLPPHEVLLDEKGRALLFRLDGALVRVLVDERQVGCLIAATSRAEAQRALDTLMAAWPESHPEPTRTSRITFWNWNGRTAASRTRDIETPPWHEIRGNYALATAEPLTQLFERTTALDAGRLILWHGSPGTGKTHLIRALAHAWSAWCSTEYVIDIDSLLNGSSEYLTSMILDPTDRHNDPKGERWRLVVLEDAGEFLMPDAPATQGQGFSRLLNTLDGMLGQTARLMVLATTNRPLSALDPSIVRPGRCGQELEIPPLSAGEAAAWLAARDHRAPVGGPATLAQLFGMLRGDQPPPPKHALGFAA